MRPDREQILVRPPDRPIDVSIGLPASKSISNRALIIASLCGSRNALHGLSDADDTVRLDRLLRERPRLMDCGAGGTTLRFLLAWAAIQEGSEHVITGIPRLLERPHDDLVNALRAIGGEVVHAAEGFLVKGKRLKGGKVTMISPRSSQFVSALLLVAPYTEEGIEILWKGERNSEPYVRMTCSMMERSGAVVDLREDRIGVRPGTYSMDRYSVPLDRSAASFWYEIAAFSGHARIELPGLFDDGLQGDAEAAEFWRNWVSTDVMGTGTVLRSRERRSIDRPKFDLRNCPDLFQPLALSCAGLGVEASFTGLGTLPLKETDRIAATGKVLSIFGGSIQESDQLFLISPINDLRIPDPVIIDPEGDHRMAMSAAPLALLTGGIRILDPVVVEKSYPRFWEHLRAAGFSITPVTV